MLASVTGPAEAVLALAGGADLIDLKDPGRGALGAVSPAVVRDTVAVVSGRRPVSAVTGDLPMQPDIVFSAALAMAEAGAEYVKCGVFPGGQPQACVRALAGLANRAKLVAVLFADLEPDFGILPLLAECGFAGAMLDTARKGEGRLLDRMAMPNLRGFVEKCRALGLITGLAGALEAPDVPRLLVLAPDFLGFRGALCGVGGRAGASDPVAVAAIRALIPSHDSVEPFGADLLLLAARGYAPPTLDPARADRVFVRDLVLPVHVGAYGFERDAPQRVRFEVEAAVRRAEKRPAEGMADVFSYDLITDGIRMLLASGHVALLETLAERIAALLLAHRAVLRVTVRLEKLDVGQGVVGCIVERAREGLVG
jgi:dihydroneopterin aldolase